MWLVRHLLSVFGFILWAPVIFRGVKSIVGFGGDLDFLLSRAQEPGWVGVVLTWMLAPPDWLLLPLIVLGGFLIWLDVNRPWAPKPKPAQIMVECFRDTYPKTVPLGEQIYDIDFWWEAGQGRTIGMGHRVSVPNAPDAPDWYAKNAYRCDITNFGPEPIFDVVMTFIASLNEVVPQSTGQTIGREVYAGEWTVRIPKILPGRDGRFCLYLLNTGLHHAEVAIPTSASYVGLSGGSGSRHTCCRRMNGGLVSGLVDPKLFRPNRRHHLQQKSSRELSATYLIPQITLVFLNPDLF